MEIKPGLPVLVKTTSKSSQAENFIITAGPWTNQLLHPLGIELPLQVCYHHGNNADPEERDCPSAFSDIQDVQILSCFVRDHLPDLQPEPAIMEHCMYTNTPDEHFILDRHPKYDNIVIGAGFSGHGFKLSPVVGKILYELSMKLTPYYGLTPFRISRFPGLGKALL